MVPLSPIPFIIIEILLLAAMAHLLITAPRVGERWPEPVLRNPSHDPPPAADPPGAALDEAPAAVDQARDG